MPIRLVLALFLVASSALAQDAPRITQEDRDRAQAAIAGWSSFEGVWEGELKYVVAPVEDWYKLRPLFKLVVERGLPRAQYRDENGKWVEFGATYQVLQPDKLTLVIYAHSARGVWTQGNVIVLTRRTENTAKVFVQRVVNNWVVPAQPSEDPVFGDTRVGEAERRVAPVPPPPSVPPGVDDDTQRTGVDSPTPALDA